MGYQCPTFDKQATDMYAVPYIWKPEDTRRRNLKRLYGMTPEQFNEMRAKQDYRCAICRRHEDEIYAPRTGRARADGTWTMPPKLQVDHCHRSKVVRALLCGPCNATVGAAEEDAARLRACADYVDMLTPSGAASGGRLEQTA
jgi:uncharacterized protein (DUF2461 family)